MSFLLLLLLFVCVCACMWGRVACTHCYVDGFINNIFISQEYPSLYLNQAPSRYKSVVFPICQPVQYIYLFCHYIILTHLLFCQLWDTSIWMSQKKDKKKSSHFFDAAQIKGGLSQIDGVSGVWGLHIEVPSTNTDLFVLHYVSGKWPNKNKVCIVCCWRAGIDCHLRQWTAYIVLLC
jgi:hypothetical protein